MFRRFLRTDDDVSALVMRLTLGVVFFPHGAQKVLGWFGGPGASNTIQFFSKQGLPPALTVLVMAAELGGSILLILGFLTRLAALGIGCVMAGGPFLGPAQGGFFLDWGGGPKGGGVEDHPPAPRPALALFVKG